MFARLWRFLRHTPEAPPQAARPAASGLGPRAEESTGAAAMTPPPLPRAAAAVGAADGRQTGPETANDNALLSSERRPSEEAFFTRLAQTLKPIEALGYEEDAQISALVLQVVAYVTQKKLDPPVVPALVPRVLAIVDEPEVDLVKLTHVIQQDLAISAKLLSVANSPLFGSSTEIKTVRQAIAHLGTEQVAQIAIGLACRSSLDSTSREPSPFAARWQRLFQHAMTCAFTAAHLTGKQDKAAQEAAFLGGLFHDVGKAVALRALEALIAHGAFKTPSEEMIDELLQRIHAYPGDEFYDKWTLPESLMDLCARHHQLDELVYADPQLERSFHLVCLASSFDSLLTGNAASRRSALAEARTSADRLGMPELALRAAYADVQRFGERTARMFQ